MCRKLSELKIHHKDHFIDTCALPRRKISKIVNECLSVCNDGSQMVTEERQRILIASLVEYGIVKYCSAIKCDFEQARISFKFDIPVDLTVFLPMDIWIY